MEEIYKWSNIMEHYKLFPTHLFVFDDFYKDSVAEMKKYISDLWNKRDFDKQKVLL